MMVKVNARKSAFAARKAAFAAGQGQAAEILAEVLEAYQDRALAGYMAIRTEADPMAAMRMHHGPVCVPVIVAQGQPLQFRQWSPDCEMEIGPFGAEVPSHGAWIEPDVLIVPLVGFDARGYRLGYGGGFYDRTLQGLRARRTVVAVGFGFAAQELEEVPIDEFDQRLDLMVTEAGVRRF